jgi:hypothetical protein
VRALAIRAAAAALGAGLTLGAAPGAAGAAGGATGGTGPAVTLSGARAIGAAEVSAVAALSPVPDDPLAPADVTVTADGTAVDAGVRPVLSGRTSLSLVVDASAQAAESTAGGGLSGVASFLLQMPPDARLSVVADQDPPVLAAAPAVGPARALTATSGLRGSGSRATAAALGTAVRAAGERGRQPVVVLYTGAADAGGVPVEDLAARLRAAGAVLGVVTTAGSGAYWARLAAATGGLAVRARPAAAIPAFDRLADGLTARAVLSFSRPLPPVAAVDVAVRTDRGPAAGRLVLPAAAAQAAGDRADDRAGGRWWFGPLLVLAVVVLVGLAFWTAAGARLAGRGRAGPSSPPPVPAAWPEPPPAPPATASLFEPRSARDARTALPSPSPPVATPDPPADPGTPEELGPESPLKARFEEIRAALRAPATPGDPDDER